MSCQSLTHSHGKAYSRISSICGGSLVTSKPAMLASSSNSVKNSVASRVPMQHCCSCISAWRATFGSTNSSSKSFQNFLYVWFHAFPAQLFLQYANFHWLTLGPEMYNITVDIASLGAKSSVYIMISCFHLSYWFLSPLKVSGARLFGLS